METRVIEMGEMVCARHRIPAGFDSAPLYRGRPDDMCPREHWCHLTRAEVYRRKAAHLERSGSTGG
jgi:hypothetical protein